MSRRHSDALISGPLRQETAKSGEHNCHCIAGVMPPSRPTLGRWLAQVAGLTGPRKDAPCKPARDIDSI
jgi:hypothetical protein